MPNNRLLDDSTIPETDKFLTQEGLVARVWLNFFYWVRRSILKIIKDGLGGIVRIASALLGGFYPGSIDRSLDEKVGEIPSVLDWGATGDGVTDDTTALLAALVPAGGDGSVLKRYFPIGNYAVQPGVLEIPNPQSAVWEGQGSRFGSVIISNDNTSTDYILKLGDGTFEPHNFVLRDISIDAADGAPADGALLFYRTNLMRISNITVQSIGAGGLAMGSTSTAPLFGEMIFTGCFIVSGDAALPPTGSTGVRFYPTGNIDFMNSSVENFETGLWMTYQNQQAFVWMGGHVERIATYAFILENCLPFIICNRVTGGIWLGNDVVNGVIQLAANSGAWVNGGIVDNGFGNTIRVPASQLFIPGNKASYGSGLHFEGNEWLRVENLNDDPTFLNGATDWSAGASATLSGGDIPMPGVTSGKSLLVLDTGGGSGYAERTFTAEASTDYLVQVGLLARSTEQYRIVVLNSGGTVWDSGNFGYSMAVPEWQSYKVIRKRISVAADTVFKVRIYAVNASQTTICPLVLISKSQIKMATDFITSGTGFTSIGSGVTLAWQQETQTGAVLSDKVTTIKGRCYARAVVTMGAGLSGAIGIGNDGNDPNAGPIITLRPGTAIEYVIPLSSYPSNSVVKFYSFSGAPNTITVSEVGIYPINDAVDSLAGLTDGWVRSDRADGTSRLSTDQEALWLGANRQSNWQAAASAANAFTRASFGSNIYWDQAGAHWVIPDSGGSDWAAMLELNSGEIGFACETGLTLPTTRTNAQVLAAIKFKITPGSEVQSLVGKLTLLSGSDQATIHVYPGDPNSNVTDVLGSTVMDPTTPGFWVKASGGFGNTGWVNILSALASGVTSLNALTGALAITSPLGTIDINPTGSDIELEMVPLTTHAAASSQLITTTSFQDIPNCSVTLNRAGTWLIRCAVEAVPGTGDGVTTVQLVVNGSAQTVFARGSEANQTQMLGQEWRITSVTSGWVAKLQGKKNTSGGGGSFIDVNSTITAEWAGF